MAQRIFPEGTRVRIHAGSTDKFGTVIAPEFDGCNTVKWDDEAWNKWAMSYFMGEIKQVREEPAT